MQGSRSSDRLLGQQAPVYLRHVSTRRRVRTVAAALSHYGLASLCRQLVFAKLIAGRG